MPFGLVGFAYLLFSIRHLSCVRGKILNLYQDFNYARKLFVKKEEDGGKKKKKKKKKKKEKMS